MTETKLANSKFLKQSLTHYIYYIIISNCITENAKKQEFSIGIVITINHKLRLYRLGARKRAENNNFFKWVFFYINQFKIKLESFFT